MQERGVPRKNYDILNKYGDCIGIVTSGTLSPSLKIGLGMGYVLIDDALIGNQIFISIRGKSIRAEIVKMPFCNDTIDNKYIRLI